MSVSVGAGWRLVHLTDRVIELRKDDPVYRRFTDREGYVRLRAEPGMDRNALIEQATRMAERNDEALAKRIAKQLMPSVRSLGEYRTRQRQLARVFGVPGHEERTYRP